MSTRTIGRIVGGLILLAYVVYIVGGALVDAGSGDLSEVVAKQSQVSAGALLMLLNSAAVASIGVLVFPVLRPHHELSAYAYLVCRVIEATMMAVGVLGLLLLVALGQEYVGGGFVDASVLPSLASVAQEGNRYAYQFGMISLGLGSLLFCRVLLRARLVPRFMAVWGLVGYAIFLTGSMLEVLGYGVSLALSVPGGLFEIALAVLLIVKGFPSSQPQAHQRLGLTNPDLPRSPAEPVGVARSSEG
jgi:Domain of unknown function (DUF4386)